MRVPEAKQRAGPASQRRRRIVTVIGSGLSGDPHSAEVGQLIARLGFDLLTGGGRGVMAEVSRAFFEVAPRKGLIIGVIPATVEPLGALEHRQIADDVHYVLPPGYPNEWVEIAVYTHLAATGSKGTLGSSRNHITVLSADAIVALPGQEGTWSEIWLATQYRVPIIAYGDHGPIAPLGIVQAATIDELRDFLERYRMEG